MKRCVYLINLITDGIASIADVTTKWRLNWFIIKDLLKEHDFLQLAIALV